MLKERRPAARRQHERRPAADARDRARAHVRTADPARRRALGRSPRSSLQHTVSMIKQLKDEFQLTVLMAEQNFQQALRIADHGYIIAHGEIVFEGKTADALRNNELIKSLYLGA